MTGRVALVVASVVIWSGFAPNSVRSAPPSPQGAAPGIPGVVATGATIELLDKWDPSYGGEGPVATPDGDLLFAQQDKNTILRIDSEGKLSTFLQNVNRTTGLAYDRAG